MFATNLEEIALKVNGIYNKIEDLSDVSPTILNLTGAYTSLVDDDDLQVIYSAAYLAQAYWFGVC